MSYNLKYTFAALPKTYRGQPIVLGGDPKGKNFLYTNGNSVIIRDIDNPEIADIYTQHSCTVNVAKYSPSGFYIASGDKSGKLRIWDTVNKEHLLKNEYNPMGGPINDIAWSPDSQRIVVVGSGRQVFGHVFLAETGTSVGEITGQSKPINTCDYRPTRPFRIVTGSEDNTVGVYEGPPFKFKMTKQEHQRYVQSVRYAPDGGLFASGGYDGRIYLYNGQTSDLVGEVGEPADSGVKAHAGGVYGVAFSPDGRQLLSASGDRTCKIWDVETRAVVSTFSMGDTTEDQQQACLWQGAHLLSVSLSGAVNYLNVADPHRPLRVLRGHNRPIVALTVSLDRGSVFTSSHDGSVTRWQPDGNACSITGTGHETQVNVMRPADGRVYTCGNDDTLKTIQLDGDAYGGLSLPLGSQPRGLDVRDGLAVVACVRQLHVLRDDRPLVSQPVDYEPSCAAIGPDGHVAVGSGTSNTLHVYRLLDGRLEPLAQLEHLGSLTDCAYSPDDKYLVACDAHRKVVLYALPDYKLAHGKEWGFHNARVNTVAWSPDSLMVASGSLDTNIIIWFVEQPAKHLIIKSAHMQSSVNGLSWLDNETLVSVGQDCNTKLWSVTV